MIIVFFLRVVLLVASYLLGSVSSAVIVCRLLSLPDPRTEGSQNPGTTNVLRIGGKFAAAMTLLGDFLKGFLPVLLAAMLGMGSTMQTIAMLCAIIGHIFPVFFDFRGGKGIATVFGGAFALSLYLGLLCALVWVAVAAYFRYSSLAGLVMLIVLPFAGFFLVSPIAFIPLTGISAVVIWRHNDNIQRLRAGKESRIRFK